MIGIMAYNEIHIYFTMPLTYSIDDWKMGRNQSGGIEACLMFDISNHCSNPSERH